MRHRYGLRDGHDRELVRHGLPLRNRRDQRKRFGGVQCGCRRDPRRIRFSTLGELRVCGTDRERPMLPTGTMHDGLLSGAVGHPAGVRHGWRELYLQWRLPQRGTTELLRLRGRDLLRARRFAPLATRGEVVAPSRRSSPDWVYLSEPSGSAGTYIAESFTTRSAFRLSAAPMMRNRSMNHQNPNPPNVTSFKSPSGTWPR
jgi:hypothetical protein